ncbi:hypothetical protein S245_041519, partial [Arachis hypogaea]
ELIIRNCPMLRGDLPNHLPSLQLLKIIKCSNLSSCLPRVLTMTSLHIVGGNKVRIGELPPLLRQLSIKGKHQVEVVQNLQEDKEIDTSIITNYLVLQHDLFHMFRQSKMFMSFDNNPKRHNTLSASTRMADVVQEVGVVPDPTQIDVKLFNRWSFDDVQVTDISLADYIGVVPSKHATYVPHTAGRYSVKRFRKAQCPIVERLTNSLMMHGRNNGKKLMAVRIIKHAMEIIHLLTDQNPIQVIVDAVINSGPREDATRIGSAGVVRRQAVDISPLRRVNQAIYLLTTGAREAAFRNIKTIAECLADELINAAKGSSNSYAIKKKDEIERVAKANR